MICVYLNLTRFCFSVPYALCIEKNNVKKSKQKTKYIIKITFPSTAQFEIKGKQAVARRCSVKMVFLEILQNSQENTCARVSEGWAFNFIKGETLTQVFSCEFCKISKNTFFNRTPLVAAYYDELLFIFVPMINPLVQATPYHIETK